MRTLVHFSVRSELGGIAHYDGTEHRLRKHSENSVVIVFTDGEVYVIACDYVAEQVANLFKVCIFLYVDV